MNTRNVTIQTGRLTADPVVRTTAGQNPKKVSHYSIAVKRVKEGVDFFNVVAFDRGADFAEKFLKKGMLVTVMGELRNNNYSLKDGTKVRDNQIIADKQDFAESKKQSAGEVAGTTEEGYDYSQDFAPMEASDDSPWDKLF